MPPDKSVAAREGRIAERARVRACGAQVLLYAQRRLALDAALKDVIDRAADLEMAYNLNDCVELRWGAPDSSDEAATCKRHAPAAQRAKMSELPRLVPRAPPAAAGLIELR